MAAILRYLLLSALMIMGSGKALAEETLTLNQALQAALDHNPDLKREEAELARAKGDKQSLGALLPSPPRLGVTGETAPPLRHKTE